MDRSDVLGIVRKQLAKELNCKESDFDYGKITVTERANNEATSPALNGCFFGGGAVFSVKKELVENLRGFFEGHDPNWIFESKTLIGLAEKLYLSGNNIDDMHQFYVPDPSLPKTTMDFEVRRIEKAELCKFKNEPAAKELFCFEHEGLDSFGIAAYENGKLIGAACAVKEAEKLWQVGVSVLPEKTFGILTEKLAGLIKDAVLEMGEVPYFGDLLRSIPVSSASNAGFLPCWSRMVSRPRDDEFIGLRYTF